MPYTKVVKLKLMKVFLFSCIFLTVNGKKAKKKSSVIKSDEFDFDGDVFCKNRSRLIRMEKSDEIYIVDSVINNSVLLQCKFCEEKDNGLPKTWSKQKHIFTGNITEIDTDMDNNFTTSKIFINEQHSLILRSLQLSDLGLYFCKAPFIETPDKSFNYLIDLSSSMASFEVRGTVSDYKNYSRNYITPINDVLANRTYEVDEMHLKMVVFTDWSEWSECESCYRKEGIKYRFGRCRIKPICPNPKECLQRRLNYKSFVFSDKQNTEKDENIKGEVADIELVKENIFEFGIALSCRSLLLLTLTPELFNLTVNIPDFMLTDKCKGVCRLKQSKKDPRYKKSIILAKGAHLTLVCPDSTIDSVVVWEHNKLRLYPTKGIDYIEGTTEPRVYVDTFNTLYLVEVTDAESGNYTCFVDGLRMQEVKIIVLTRSLFFTKEFRRHLKYLGFVFILCFIGYLSGVTIMCFKTHTERNRRNKVQDSDTEKLLGHNTSEGYDSESSY